MDWKQLRNTASEVAGKMVDATGELVEKGKKQVDILSLENQLAKAQRQLGALVYTMNRSGAENPALMQRYMEEIDSIQRQLDACKNDVLYSEGPVETSAVRLCAQCGRPVADDAVFCPACGAKL